EARRKISRTFGAHESLHPEELKAGEGEFDLCLEVSGRPQTLDQAIAVTGYGGRIVVGSWYGNKSAPLNLGGSFHRGRITLLSSQVSTIDPALRGRWDKRRRMDLCLEMLGRLPFGELITHRIPLEEAARAYQLLEERESGALQVLLTYQE
ncbi:MAG: zinc-binding alcohol dehydrogenase, partial [Candidatus Eremiobacteraeota bacterium]|nr:zinc-binding alcohol dehydrogenase [Candidatus Eremiobacteraeota bacterium]